MTNGLERLDASIGFIGAGAMAEAIVAGAIERAVVLPDRLRAYDIRHERLEELKRKYGINMAEDLPSALAADIIVLAVKPQHLASVLDEIAPTTRRGQLFVSVAAGVTTQFIEQQLGGEPKVIRVMPNTPCLVGEGAIAISRGYYASADDTTPVIQLFQAVGEVMVLPEEQLDVVTGLSGSGPAYVCMVIEAMADGAVAAGLPRDIAIRLASQTVAGSGQWVKQGFHAGQHPAALRDQVTSPGGTTARGLAALEDRGVRAAFSQAVQAAAARAKELGKGS